MVRKGKGTEAAYPQSSKYIWQAVDRRRLLLVGTHHAVFEIVLPEPTVNAETNAFFPVRLRCEVGGQGLELLSKPFFVLHPEALNNMTRFALDCVDAWFLNPDMGLISVIQLSTVRPKSLAAAFLRKHATGQSEAPQRLNSSMSAAEESGVESATEAGQMSGVRAKFLGGDNAILYLVEKVYPVPVPIDNVGLLICVSQIFHFTHESIHWVGDRANTDLLFSNAILAVSASAAHAKDKLHVYGSIVPCKGMYQHSNPRLKKPFEVLCTALKVILASNGLPLSWLENDGKVVELTDDQVRKRQFSSYEDVFKDGKVFNANNALEALSRSVQITRNGALCIDYSVVVPVLVNTLSELHSFFAHLTSSKLRDIVGTCTEQLFGAQNVVTEIGGELAALEEERARNEATQSVNTIATKTMISSLRQTYMGLQLNLTQGVDFECFVPPTFDLYENGMVQHDKDTEKPIVETVLNFAELVGSDLSVFRLCVKGPSGNGKTTLCRHLAREWAKSPKRIFSGKFDLVLLVPLETATTPAYSDLEQVTLIDLVERELVRTNEDLSALLPDRLEVQTWLIANSSRILWILDGVDALEDYVANPENAVRSGSKIGETEAIPTTAGVREHNVTGLLRFLESPEREDEIVKHRIVTAGASLGKTAVHADLYLMMRLFSNTDIREYISRFFPLSEEKLFPGGAAAVEPGTASESESGTDAESIQGYHSSNDARSEDSDGQGLSPALDPTLSARARKIWLNIEKMKVLSRDLLHVPLNVELVCASYLSDPRYHFGKEESVANLFSRLYGWLAAASAVEPETVFDKQLEQHLFKLAYSSLFKSKFAGPTLSSKVFNQVPREYRKLLQETRFFEPASATGRGLRFVHARVQEYLCARYIVSVSDEPVFKDEILLRLKSKVINRNYHALFLFLVGLLHNDTDKLATVFDLVLLDERELGLLGPRGPAFVFKCFEETNFNRYIRSRLIDWFWERVGKPRMQIWRGNFVINLLELIVFKLSKAGATEAENMTVKAKAMRTLGTLGVESSRVVQMLVKAARSYPSVTVSAVAAFRDLGTADLAVVPVLLDALKATTPEDLKLVLGEVRRLIVPSEAAAGPGPITAKPTTLVSSKSPGRQPTTPVKAKSVTATAATKLMKIGMSCIESNSNSDLLCEVLLTLAQWRYSDDSCLPLLVKALEHDTEAVRRAAVFVAQHVDLLGPNVYYNEKVIRLLESIGRKEKALRGDVVTCFVALGMDNDFVRQLLTSCILQTEDMALQSKILLLCAQYNLRHSSVLEAMVRLAKESVDQQSRRVAIDCLAFTFLGTAVGQAEVNACVDTLYGLGISSMFATHRITRMAEKKSKAQFLTFAEFASKYIV